MAFSDRWRAPAARWVVLQLQLPNFDLFMLFFSSILHISHKTRQNTKMDKIYKYWTCNATLTLKTDQIMTLKQCKIRAYQEVMANLAVRNSGDAEASMEEVENRISEWCPTERAGKTIDEAPGDREEVLVTNERKETKQAPPRDEAARAKAATVHMYQKRATREETLGRKSKKEQPKETPKQRIEGGVDSQAKSDVTPPRRRRRLIIVDEIEEEYDVIFIPLDALPSSGLPAPPTEVDGSDERRKERKRKGKAIATPVKKKVRNASSTLVIQEGRQSLEEVENEEDKSLRRERRSKRRNDRAMSSSEHMPNLARIQNETMQVHLDNDLLGRMITFNDPQLTKECEARIGRGKKVRGGRRLNEDALEKLEAIGEFMEYITGIGFDWLLVPSSPQMPIELAQEFFTTFCFTNSTDIGAESISFRLFTNEMRMSIREWSVKPSSAEAKSPPTHIPRCKQQAINWKRSIPKTGRLHKGSATEITPPLTK